MDFRRERTGKGGWVTASITWQKVFTRRKWVPTGCHPPPSIRQPVSALGGWQITKQLQGAWAGAGTYSGSLQSSALLPLLPPAWCATLNKLLCKSPLASYDCLVLQVQLKAFLNPVNDQGRRKALNWTLLSALWCKAKPPGTSPYAAQPTRTLSLVEMRTIGTLLESLLGNETLWPRFSSPDAEELQEMPPCAFVVWTLQKQWRETDTFRAVVFLDVQCSMDESWPKSVCSSLVTMKGVQTTVSHAGSYTVVWQDYSHLFKLGGRK